MLLPGCRMVANEQRNNNNGRGILTITIMPFALLRSHTGGLIMTRFFSQANSWAKRFRALSYFQPVAPASSLVGFECFLCVLQSAIGKTTQELLSWIMLSPQNRARSHHDQPLGEDIPGRSSCSYCNRAKAFAAGSLIPRSATHVGHDGCLALLLRVWVPEFGQRTHPGVCPAFLVKLTQSQPSAKQKAILKCSDCRILCGEGLSSWRDDPATTNPWYLLKRSGTSNQPNKPAIVLFVSICISFLVGWFLLLLIVLHHHGRSTC